MSNATLIPFLFAVVWCSTQLSILSAQDLSTIRGYAKPGPNPNSTHDLSQLLEYPEIASELGVDLHTIYKLRDDVTSSLTDKLLAIKADTSEERVKELMKVTAEHTANQEATLEELLTPGQMRRLKQIAYRIEASRIGLYGALNEGWLGENIKLSTRNQVLKQAAKIDAEIREKIKALNAEGEARIMALLAPADKKAVERLLGAPIDVRQRTPDELRLENLKNRAKANGVEK